jgi:hypothetical protein
MDPCLPPRKAGARSAPAARFCVSIALFQLRRAPNKLVSCTVGLPRADVTRSSLSWCRPPQCPWIALLQDQSLSHPKDLLFGRCPYTILLRCHSKRRVHQPDPVSYFVGTVRLQLAMSLCTLGLVSNSHRGLEYRAVVVTAQTTDHLG